MFAPRAYVLRQASPPDNTLRYSEKDNGIRARVEKYNRSRSTSPNVAPAKAPQPRAAAAAAADKDRREAATARPTIQTRTATEPLSVPSKPVFIPPRSPSLDPATGRRRRRSRHDGRTRPGLALDGSSHDGRATAPAVAALLAVTNIPPPNRRARHFKRTGGPQPFQKTTIDELLQGWRDDDLPGSTSFQSGSPLDLLLGAADDSESEDASYVDADDSSLPPHSISSRSVSSESITSMPDLVREGRSLPSWGSPTTPDLKRKPFRGHLATSPAKNGKDRVVSSPPKEDCLADHPLLIPPPPALQTSPPGSPEFRAPAVKQQRRPLPQARKSSLKSNLTASFNAIASSFRSFSNFAAPSIPPDDLLTRNMFPSSPSAQQHYSSEMRPRSSDGVPDAALRRYLNPNQHTRRLSLEDASLLSAQTLHPSPDFAAASASSSNLALALELEGPLIPLQTYGPNRRPRKLPRPPPRPPAAPARDPNSEAGRAALTARAGLRQREPRENSDFLRVIVLEMNMRREGKLDARGVGRARVWLPPRRMGALDGMEAKRRPAGAEPEGEAPRVDIDECAGRPSVKVPRRWSGVGVDD